MRSLTLVAVSLLIISVLCASEEREEGNDGGKGVGEERKPLKAPRVPFPAHTPKPGQVVVYDNGHTDYSVGFEMVSSPGGSPVAAIMDDFALTADVSIIGSFQFIAAESADDKICFHSVRLHLTHDSQGTPNGRPVVFDESRLSFSHHVLPHAPKKIASHLGDLYLFTIHLLHPIFLGRGHYWFHLTATCKNATKSFALAKKEVLFNEARIEVDGYSGTISGSPFTVPSHDFAFVIITPEHGF
jgi:hypothetical protein